MARILSASGFAAFLALVVAPVSADLDEGLGPVPASLQRSNPRAAVVGYLTAAREGDFGTAATYLDLGEIEAGSRAVAGARLSRRFKIVLDNAFWVDPEAVSDQALGALDDGLPPNSELLTSIELGERLIPIRLHSVGLDEGGNVWLFDRRTVAAIDQLYQTYGYGWLGDHLPAMFFTVRIFEVELWQIAGLVLLVGVGWAVARTLGTPLTALVDRGVRKTSPAWDDELAVAVGGPLRAGLFAFAVFFGSQWLGLSAPVEGVLAVFWRLIAIFILGWLLSTWVSVGAGLIEKTATAEGGSLARSFIPIFARVIRIGVWCLVFVVGLDAAGIEVMGLIAGLGIGGLAIAFAAKRTIENFFGALAIASDRPFEVGDYVDLGGVTGTVEEVGLRSTRLRTIARTMITIPNRSVMGSQVENFSARDRILFNPTIGLVYGTTRSQIEIVIDEIKKLLLRHPKIYRESLRVRMSGFGASSVDVSILSWVETTDYHEYTAVVEELNLEIMRIVEEAGTGFAFPSQTLYLGRDSGTDPALTEKARAEVDERREAGDLWLPEPPEHA